MSVRTVALLTIAMSAVFAAAIVIVDSQTATLWLIAAWFVPFSLLSALAARARGRQSSERRD